MLINLWLGLKLLFIVWGIKQRHHGNTAYFMLHKFNTYIRCNMTQN